MIKDLEYKRESAWQYGFQFGRKEPKDPSVQEADQDPEHHHPAANGCHDPTCPVHGIWKGKVLCSLFPVGTGVSAGKENPGQDGGYDVDEPKEPGCAQIYK